MFLLKYIYAPRLCIFVSGRYHSTKVTPKCRSSDRSVRIALLAYMAARVFFQNIPGTISQFQIPPAPRRAAELMRISITIIVIIISVSYHHDHHDHRIAP